MKAGYARVSTKDQTVDLQVDTLKRAGCTKVYTEVMNGSRAHARSDRSYSRPAVDPGSTTPYFHHLLPILVPS
jgi:DNA invertase Pin-like site-specific DNA recombinase